MEEGEKTKNNEAEKVDDQKEEGRLHSKEVKGPRDSIGEDNLLEKQVVEATIEGQHFVQFHPPGSAPPQPTMVQVNSLSLCFHQ